MSGKFALIIGNTEYSDPGLAQLTAPGKDAEDFAHVLRDHDICAFDDVNVLLNQPSYVVGEAIDAFFYQKKPDDLLIVYFSGHGVRDEFGALYLAVKNTSRARLRATAIRSDYIREAMDQSRSKRQVVILDCCNSGAFPQGTKAEAGGMMGMVSALQGYGRFVLTASDATQFAWEGDKVIGETQNSLFTHFLVQGLKGEADRNSDGKITVDELYDYAFDEISKLTPKQTPTKSISKQEGEIILRQIRRIEDIKPIALPEDLISEIEDLRPYVREAAVQKLEKIVKGRNIGLARSAIEALEKIATDDNTTRRVAQMASQVLESVRQAEQKAEEERRAKEETERLAASKAEEERLAIEKAKAERKVKEEAEQEAAKREAARRQADLQAAELAAREAAKEKAEKEAVEREALKLAAGQTLEGKVKEKATGQETKIRRPLWLMVGGAIITIALFGYLVTRFLPFGGGTATQPPANGPIETQPPATQAAATVPASNPGATPECRSPDVFCVGLVTDVGRINDKSFNQSAWEGIQEAEQELGAHVQYIETTDSKDYAKNITTFGDEGYDVIVTVGFALGEATSSAAVNYPNIDFIGVDQFQTEILDNVVGLNFPEDNAGFLVGALASTMSKSHKIGAVCGTDVVPAVWRFGEGYKAGAAYADQQNSMTTEVFVVYHSDVGFDKTFTDPEWGAQTAQSMMDQGADVIFGCGGTTGNGAVIQAAQSGAYAIGVDTDQYLTLTEAAPRMLSSGMKLITPGVFDLIKLSKEGRFLNGNYFGDAGYAPFHDLESEVPAEVKTMMEEINAGLLEGSIKTNVPSVKP